MQLKIARASVAAPNCSHHAGRPRSLVGLGSTAERQPVGPLDLPAGVGPGLARQPGGEGVGQVKHQGIVHQREGLERRGRDGARGAVVDGSGQSNASSNGLRPPRAQARKSVRRLRPGVFGIDRRVQHRRRTRLP